MKAIVLTALLLGSLAPQATLAFIPDTYNNANIFSAVHDAPRTMSIVADDQFMGFTQTGKYYWHRPVANTAGVRLHKFSIDEAFFYMSDRGLITATTDLAAVSIYLARV